MTEAEIKALADEMAARAKAAKAAVFTKVKTFVLHNALGLAVGAGGALAIVKFL